MPTANWNNTEIAKSDDTIVIEGNHYFPAESIDPAMLEDSSTTSGCPWKGTATYKTLVVNGKRNPDAVWTYIDPKPAAKEIAGRYAFWKGVTVT